MRTCASENNRTRPLINADRGVPRVYYAVSDTFLTDAGPQRAVASAFSITTLAHIGTICTVNRLLQSAAPVPLSYS